MALKVNKEYGVTIGGEHYPLKSRKKLERTEENSEEIDALIEQGYLVDTDADDEPEPAPAPTKATATAKKGKGGK